MNRLSRLATGDKVEIIDRGSPDFRKTGKVIKCVCKPLTMINSGGKSISSGVLTLCEVKLEDTGTIGEFTVDQLRKIP